MNKNKKLCIITLIILFLFSISVHADACGNIKIGVIGASNAVPYKDTATSSPRSNSYSFADALREICPNSEIVVRARGSTCPDKQYSDLLPNFANFFPHGANLLIVNPSGNCLGNNKRHINGVVNIVTAAKNTYKFQKVAVMETGIVDLGKARIFNENLASTKLGVPDKIDLVLDAITPVSKSNDRTSGWDDKYGKNRHFKKLGDYRLAVSFYNQLFSANHPLPSSKTEWGSLVEKFKKISSPVKPLISGSKPAPQPTLLPGTSPLFSFAVISDTHDHGGCLIGQGESVKKAAKLIAAKKPAFVIGAGDLIAGYGSKCKDDLELGTKQLNEFKKQFLDNLGGIPFLPVSGNHDLMGLNINDNTIKLIDQWKTFWNQRKPSGLQISGDYPFNYRLEHKGSGFAFSKYHVPNYYGKRHGLEQGELNWINSNVKANDLFFRHVNPYGVSCDEKGQCGFAMGSRGSIKNYEQLITTLKSRGIKALFAGHNQAFYDGVCDGLRFVDTGTLGKREIEFVPGHPEFEKQAFVWVDVMTDGKLIVNFYVYENGRFSLFNKQLFPDKVEAKKVNRGKHYEGVAATCISVKDKKVPTPILGRPSPQPLVKRGGPSACPTRPSQNCQDNQRCKQIDQAWLQVSYLIDGSLSGYIFDTGTNTAELLDTTYCVSKPQPEKKIQSPAPKKPIIPGKTKGMGLSGLTEGCKLTPPPAEDTQAIGSPTCGYLENGIKTSTTSFISSCQKKGYSTKTDKTDEEVCYATIELVQTLELASCAMEKLHGVRFVVKDRSYPQGGACYRSKAKAEKKPPEEFCKLIYGRGTYSFHSSHQNGLDADVGLYYDPGGGLINQLWNMFKKEGVVSPMFNNKKALQANWDFLKIISSVYDLQLVYLDQKLIDLIEKHAKSKGEWETYKDKINLEDEPGHKNHYHVRIKCPKNDLKCEGPRSTMDKPTGNIKITQPSPKQMLNIAPKIITQLTGDAGLDPLKADCSAAEIKHERKKRYKELCKKDYSSGFAMDEANLFEYYKTHYIVNQKLLREIHLKNTDKTKLYNLGNSVKGRPILALQITNPSSGYKPPVFVNCAHHSDEIITPEYCYQIINDLLTDGRDSYLDYFDFWVVPVVNVDRRSRLNVNKVNLNRNYPFKWGIRNRNTKFPGKSPASEPETKAIMNLFNQKHFVYAISFHSSGPYIIYGYTSPGTTDPEPHFQKEFSKVMIKDAQLRLNKKGKYTLRKKYYLVSGADQDWYQAEHGAIAILVEAPKKTSYKDTRDIVRGYMPGFWATLDYYRSLPKLRVKVVDSDNNPVVAKVMAEELKYFNGEEFHTDPVYGIREIIFLNEGVYTIDVEKGGKTKSINYNVQSGTQEEVITLT